jgi:preprotein translocase subunit SecF
VRVGAAGEQPHWLIRVQEVSTISAEKATEFGRAVCFGEALDGASCPADKAATEMKVSPGGDKITLRYAKPPDLTWLRQRASSVGGIVLREGQNNPSVVSARDNKVEVQLKSRGDQIMDGLRSSIGADQVPAQPLRVEWIGPKAGKLLRDSAVKSVVISIIFVMVYIAFRFDIRFAPGGVLSLLHDSLGTLLILILLKKEISLQTIAALLTIVGYSINDTVVVYDRIRENLPKLRGASFRQIINISTSEMLGRTILTSLTTVISLLAFFIWGTGALRDFALTLIVGILFGTYSSIYIACPFTEWLDQRFFSKLPQRTTPKLPANAGPAV